MTWTCCDHCRAVPDEHVPDLHRDPCTDCQQCRHDCTPTWVNVDCPTHNRPTAAKGDSVAGAADA